MRMQALRAGAVEFLAKPFDDELCLRAFERPWRVERLWKRDRDTRRSSAEPLEGVGSGDQTVIEDSSK